MVVHIIRNIQYIQIRKQISLKIQIKAFPAEGIIPSGKVQRGGCTSSSSRDSKILEEEKSNDKDKYEDNVRRIRTRFVKRNEMEKDGNVVNTIEEKTIRIKILKLERKLLK